jgi:hypothetical protein
LLEPLKAGFIYINFPANTTAVLAGSGNAMEVLETG